MSLQGTAEGAMSDLPELPDPTKRKLAIEWDALLDHYGLTVADLDRYTRASDRIRRIAVAKPPETRGRWFDSWLVEHERAKKESGITPSVAVAKRRFAALASEYWLLWESSATGYETHKGQLDAIKRRAVDELASIWKGHSNAARSWYETACAPAIEQALGILMRERTSQARHVELGRLARASTEGRMKTSNPILDEILAGGDNLSPQAQEAIRLARVQMGLPKDAVIRMAAATPETPEPSRLEHPEPIAVIGAGNVGRSSPADLDGWEQLSIHQQRVAKVRHHFGRDGKPDLKNFYSRCGASNSQFNGWEKQDSKHCGRRIRLGLDTEADKLSNPT
jgi:hypothetical protein